MAGRARIFIGVFLLCAGWLRAQTIPPGEPETVLEKAVPNESATKPRPTVNVTGTLQGVSYWFGQTAANVARLGMIPDAAAIRRAQLGAFGEWNEFDYRLVIEFSTNTGNPELRDAFGRLNNLPWIGSLAFGNVMEPYGFERIASNRFLTFIERSAVSQAFAPARNIGLLAHDTYGDERGTWSLGVFRFLDDEPSEDTGPIFSDSLTGRVTILPVWDEAAEKYLHLGASYSVRGVSDNTLQFEARPEASLRGAPVNVPFFVNTGTFAANLYQLGGFEFVAARGPWNVQAEYNLAAVNSDRNGHLFFWGGYVYVSWLITGEHRPYNRKTAVNNRIVPLRDFLSSDRGPGAWEVAARLTYVDLNSGPVIGGRLYNVTGAVNWYLSANCRFTFNYIHSIASLGGSANIFGIRLGYDF